MREAAEPAGPTEPEKLTEQVELAGRIEFEEPSESNPPPEPKISRHELGIKKPRWWPDGLANGLSRVAAVAFRGCWHERMSWPIVVEGYCYRVCPNCGAMRLFDEGTFSAYGPVRYRLSDLMAWEKTKRSAPKLKPGSLA